MGSSMRLVVSIFFVLPNLMKCDDNINSFISDLISSFRLISPTLIYHGDAPEICFTHLWVLCLNLENEQAILTEEKGWYTTFRLIEWTSKWIIHWLKCIFFVESSGVCVTVAGPVTGEKCIFPFTVDGVTYTHCAFDRYETTPEYAIWCSTKVNDAGFHIGGNWGGCSEDCPLEGKNITFHWSCFDWSKK